MGSSPRNLGKDVGSGSERPEHRVETPIALNREPHFRPVREMISTGVALLALLGGAAAFSAPPPTSGIWTTRQKASKNAPVLPLTPDTASLAPWQGERTGFTGVLRNALVLKATEEPAAGGGAAEVASPRLPVDFVAMAK